MTEKVYGIIDIGGTKILLMLVNDNKEILFREKFSTPLNSSPEEVARAINETATAALVQIGLGNNSMAGLGICIAAFVDYEKGLIHQAPNIGWQGPLDFRKMLVDYWGCPVYLENDANAAAMGEVAFGAAQGHRNAIYITISTGIGCGLYLDGKIFRGSAGFAGEIGHIKFFGKGRRCGCGGMDCLEAWASGTAIAHSGKLLGDGKEEAGGVISTAYVFEQARAGNPLAENIIEQALDHISIGLANLITLLNPSCLVIGGGVVKGKDDFIALINDKIRHYAIKPAVSFSQFEVVAAQLEPEAGVWGMYALLREEECLKDGVD